MTTTRRAGLPPAPVSVSSTPPRYGGKTRLLGISKRGNKYIRVQLIHGARAAMAHFVRQATPTGDWVRRLVARAHPNVVVVALAAKLARIAWAVLRHERSFDRQALVAA